jgi:hypothetical protein
MATRVEPVFLWAASCCNSLRAWLNLPSEKGDYLCRHRVRAFGIGKIFKKHPKAGTALKQWGVATGFFNSASD